MLFWSYETAENYESMLFDRYHQQLWGSKLLKVMTERSRSLCHNTSTPVHYLFYIHKLYVLSVLVGTTLAL